jgi:hypothetical protein
VGVLVLAALVIVGLELRKQETVDGVRVVHGGAVAFNLRHPAALRSRPLAAGELLRLEQRSSTGVLASFVVEPLRLPSYRGDVAGVLPVVADRELDALRKQFPSLEPVEEGKARVNKVAGYSMVFRASRKPRLYGRIVLLPQPAPGARDGVRLVMLATPAGGADLASEVGAREPLKTAFRSFRFGTEGP